MLNRTMTDGTPWKHILRFSLPVLAGSLLQQLYNTVDAIIVGKYASEAALSAVGTTGSFAFFLTSIAIGFSAGNGVVVAQHYGAGDRKKVRENASTGILFLMLLGVLVTIIGFAVAKPAFKLFVKVPDDFLDLTLRYFRIISIGFVFSYGYNIFSSILRAVGDSAATLYFLLISSVMNIILDYIFVKQFQWGVTGAATATVISQAMSFIAAYIYMYYRYPIFRFKMNEYKLNGALVVRTVQVGFPISLQMIVVSLGLTFIQRAVNEFGQAMTASFTVGQRIEWYLNLPCNAFQTTLATYTGQNIGAGKMHRVKQGVRQTFIISILMTLIISACIWIFTTDIIGMFGLSDQAAEYCLQHIRSVTLINVVLAMYIPLFGVFQGANHSSFPMFVACGALGTRVVVTYLFRYSRFFGYSIIWWNGIFGFGMGFLITWSLYLSGIWKHNAMIETVRREDY